MIHRFMMLAALVCSTAIAKVSPLMIGETVPAGPLQTVDGHPFDLLEAAKDDRLAIIYYRGGWCPYCNHQLAELNQVYKELLSLDFRIVAISPDSPEMLKKGLEDDPVHFTLLSDSTMETAKAFGIAYKVSDPMLEKLESYNIDIEAASGQTHHLLPVPSVFLIGKDGVIDFVYVNPDYTTRLDPRVLLEEARVLAREDSK